MQVAGKREAEHEGDKVNPTTLLGRTARYILDNLPVYRLPFVPPSTITVHLLCTIPWILRTSCRYLAVQYQCF